jgi:hypothetical protein
MRGFVRVATTTTGTGTYAVGAAVAGYLDPAQSGVPSGGRVPYVVVDSLTSPTRMEVGEGIYTAGAPATIARATIRRNTSGGTSAESWPAGTKYLMLAPNAATLPTIDTDGYLGVQSLYANQVVISQNGMTASAGDITALAGSLVSRISGAPSTGQVVLGSANARLYYNGTKFDLNAALDVGGYLNVSGNIGWASDIRGKEDIKPARLGLAQALRLEPVTFRRKGAKRRARRELGVIAQAAQAAHRLAVVPAEDGTLAVSAAGMDAILLGAVRDLAGQVIELRARLALLERKHRA